MSLSTVPLHKDFGLEVRGVGISTALSRELDQLLAQYGVLVFRRQFLSEEDRVRFAGAFGELERTIYTKGVSPYHREVIYISNLSYPDGGNVGLLGDQELHWHSDQTYRARPPRNGRSSPMPGSKYGAISCAARGWSSATRRNASTSIARSL